MEDIANLKILLLPGAISYVLKKKEVTSYLNLFFFHQNH